MAEQAVGREREAGMVVADAGPLIHLSELDCLGLLADFSEVRVPEAVWREIEQHRPLVLQDTRIPLVRCLPSASERVDALATLYTLHIGEHEALCLCLEFPGALLLTDDTAARLAAKTLAVEAHGTIGLLVRSIRRRQMSKEHVLALLSQIPKRSTLHIRPALLAEIIRQVAEAPTAR